MMDAVKGMDMEIEILLERISLVVDNFKAQAAMSACGGRGVLGQGCVKSQD